MTNKKIKTEFALGIILSLAFLICGLFLIANKKKINSAKPGLSKSISQPPVQPPPTMVNPILEQRPKLNCSSGWKEYYHDVLGIAFCYPEIWGKPGTDPITNLTSISNLPETFKNQNIYYDNTLNITFGKSGSLRITLFNDQYQGMLEGNANDPYEYYQSGATNDVINLKNNRDICSYVIGYYPGNYTSTQAKSLLTIYWDCKNKVKTVLTKEQHFYDSVKYTYDLRLLAFKKTSNGYFNNILINQTIDHADQIKENLGTFDDFFTAEKTFSYNGKSVQVKNKEQFEKERQQFEKFVSSMVAYKPPKRQKTEFQDIVGENPQITTIRKYYWLLSNQEVKAAYEMVSNKKSITLEKFRNWYGNINYAKPRDFREIGEATYEFHVDYEDQNNPETIYRIRMQVVGDQVNTQFSEQYLSEVATFGSYSSYVSKRGTKIYVLLLKDGNEQIIDQAVADYNSEYSNIGEVEYFFRPIFSTSGKNLIYEVGAWEYGGLSIYNIKRGKKVARLDYPENYGFSADEKYLYYCTSAGIATGPGGTVYTFPDMKVVYNLDKLVESDAYKEYMYVDCKYDSSKNDIIFRFNNDNGSEKSSEKKVIYHLDSQKEELVK